MKNLIFLSLIFLFLASCSQPVKEVYIDNPSNENLTIEFDDGKKVSIVSYLSAVEKIQFGKRMIKVNDQPEEEIILEKDFDYLLNPLKETYYIQKAKYFMSTQARDKYYENHPIETSEVDGREINGDFTKIENQLLIKKTWDLGLDQEMTETGKGYTSSKKGYLTVTKIHRKKTLLEKIDSETTKYLEEIFEKYKAENE